MDETVLMRSFTISHVLDCVADPTKNRVIAEFSDNVAAIFPYLNAILPGVIYNPAAEIVTIRRGERLLTFYAHVAVMAKVDGEQDAIAQLTWFQELCNDVWRRRAEIVPSHEPRKRLGPLDVWQLLPGLNCRACGEATCMAFAFGLLLGDRALSQCTHLLKPENGLRAQRLAELLGAGKRLEAMACPEGDH